MIKHDSRDLDKCTEKKLLVNGGTILNQCYLVGHDGILGFPKK
jgi:hypothetical protein